ncbi:leucyl aminopeptidase [Allobranchiibius huperziae]|uniref:Probable cytosol aminopeptidase n=1 Tax=Allobranchiibius huperziae TaxID=1874116 RepID=A0A853DJ85_9MICO|nr:leucyl aminopeptidase [Allobranchiibius huperziae]
MTTTVSLTAKTAPDGADVTVVLTRKGAKGAVAVRTPALTDAGWAHLDTLLTAVQATGAADEVLKFTGVPGAGDLVVATGSGLSGEPTATDAETVRRAAGAAVTKFRGTPSAYLALPTEDPALLTASVEGGLFGAYAYTAYKTGDVKAPVATLRVHASSPTGKDAKALIARAQTVAAAQNWARDLVNMPPLDLYPESFAQAVRERFSGTKVKVEVAEEAQLVKDECGGLIGVGRGSARPPRLVTLTYKPRKASAHLALVGKGITFDSGGLCIKPADGMLTMKSDMGGAAAVAATIEAVAALGLPVAVTGYLCLAENLTGADAQRPGDVVRMPNGKTVEIINTDAEGRLVMADGLSLASRLTPDLTIDVATLTGAAVVALGDQTAAVVSNEDAVREEIVDAAGRAGEAAWPMPLLEHLRAGLDSKIADVKHTGARPGGLISAALFLREFVGNGADGSQLPWAHMDIAGPAYNEKPYGYTPFGGTGYAVRTLVTLAEGRA